MQLLFIVVKSMNWNWSEHICIPPNVLVSKPIYTPLLSNDDRVFIPVHSIFWMNEEKNKKMKMVVVRESVILKPLGQKMETQSLFNCSVLGQWLAKTFWKWHFLGSNPSLGTCSHLRSKFRWWTSYFLKAVDNIL